MELFPDIDRMYVSLTPIDQPVYYMCRPEKIIVEDTAEGMMPSPQNHQAILMNGIPLIPDPIPINTGFVSLQAVADYMERTHSHLITFPCESCGGQLYHTQIAGNLKCTHFVHYDCLHRDFSCPLCNKWFY